MTDPDEPPGDEPAREADVSRGDDASSKDVRGNDSSREDIRAAGAGARRRRNRPRTPPTFQQVRQADLIIHNVDGVHEPTDWREHGVDVFYRENHVLVRDEYTQRVVDLLGPVDSETPFGGPEGEGAEPSVARPSSPRVVGLVAGVNLVRIRQPVVDALNQVADAFGGDVAAPDYLMSICPGGGCPATEPEVVPAWVDPDPGISADHAAGEGVRVVVIDTGLDPDAPASHTWMYGVTGDDDTTIIPNRGGNPDELGHYSGHGTFIAGIVRCVAPAAEVLVRKIFNFEIFESAEGKAEVGADFESNVIKTLADVLAHDHPDVISLSAGSPVLTAFGMLGMDSLFEAYLKPHKGVVLVAAAGNNRSREPFFPAASPWAVGVGALAANRRDRADYSGFGGWVDVYTPGTDLVNAFPSGIYTYTEKKKLEKPKSALFSGMARWSGTSFATPIFAGMVAARMSKTGENGATAATALLAEARDGMILGTGPVLLP